MTLEEIHRQLSEAHKLLAESARDAALGEIDPAYRAALRSRNFLFHAARGLAGARGQPLPEMPVVGIPGGALADHAGALAALEQALAAADLETLGEPIGAARLPYARYLGWLRDELGKRLRAGL